MVAPSLSQLHSDLVKQLRQAHRFTNPDVEIAFSAVPRHLFLPDVDPHKVYQDQAITLKTGSAGIALSSASQPTMMAIMLGQLNLRPGMNVLEIGTASGYNAALIYNIVGKTGHVTSLEMDRELAERAQENLYRAGSSDVLVVNRDGASGFEPRAQFDRIIATAGIWDVPANWLRQLRDEGRLVVPIWLDGVQVSAAFTPRSDGTWLSCENYPCAFVYLQGLAAGPSVRKRVGSTSLEILADDVNTIDTASLHVLLSEERDVFHLSGDIKPEDFWHGFQLYLMLNEPLRHVFAVYAIPAGETAYGLRGNGVFLFTPTSVAFAPYEEGGAVYSFGSADAFMMMQSLFDEWVQRYGSLMETLRLRLIPKLQGAPAVDTGKLFMRKDHYLHVWLD